ncbi:MAG: hypothetical protein ACOCXH_13660, partial [Cyclobacteriaceae bacterium]
MTKKEPQAVLWQAQITDQVRGYKDLARAINDFAELYEPVMAEPFTAEIYQTAIAGMSFAPIEKLFSKKADEAISATPVFGGLQQQQREHLKSELLRLRTAFDTLMSKYYNI